MHQRARFPLRFAALSMALLAALAGCAVRPVAESTTGQELELRILHINDHHSRLAPDAGNALVLDGEEVAISFGGFPAVAQAIDDLAGGHPSVLKLHAGDAITGDLYFTLFQGEADADLMNTVCFDAFVVGNHEFDTGDLGLARFIDFLRKDRRRCDTPVLGANVRPTVGVSPLAPKAADDYLRPHVVLERGGERIGIVGIDIAGKTKSSSSPDAGTQFEDEFTTAQAQIDLLQAQGIRHIVLLTHVGYRNDQRLAQSLRGVDVIVGADSHTLLGEGYQELGLTPAGEYPTRLSNADGDPVCVVQAWQYTWVVGQLDLRFDPEGRVTACEGRPQLLVGEDLRRADAVIEGAEREALLARLRAHPLVRIAQPQPAASVVLKVYQDQIESFSTEVVGQVPERLCLRRAPGPYDRSRDGAPGCAEATDVYGGHVQQVVARAFLSQGQRFGGADIAIQNGGGVRNGIAEGAFSIGNAYLALPFKNMLDRLLMSGDEVHSVLEDAYDFFLSNIGSNSGAWPYAAGLRWKVDLSRSRAQGRVSDIEVQIDGEWRPIERERTYRVITNDYIATGRDGFETFGRIGADRREPTYLHYAQALADYAKSGGDLSRPKPGEMSTQSVVFPPQHLRDMPAGAR
jgi:5'-nucleotidase